MNAYTKALKSLNRLQSVEIMATCANCGEEEIHQGTGRAQPGDGFCTTARFACREFKKAGWTFDKDGRWSCPECIHPDVLSICLRYMETP